MSSGAYRTELPEPTPNRPPAGQSAVEGYLPSMLDRLTDPESGGTAYRRGYGPEEVTAAVRRDLENLLNTRRYAVPEINEYPETLSSVANFGMPDVLDLPAGNELQRAAIGSKILEAIRRFEPRLTDVQVVLVEDIDQNDRFSLKYQVRARLAIDPSPEVNFETVVELGRGRSQVNHIR